MSQCARRIVSSQSSDSPMWRTSSSATNSGSTPTTSSMGVSVTAAVTLQSFFWANAGIDGDVTESPFAEPTERTPGG